jgi:hypothetical protein
MYTNALYDCIVVCVLLSIWMIVTRRAKTLPLIGWIAMVLLLGYVGAWAFYYTYLGALGFLFAPFVSSEAMMRVGIVVTAVLVSGLFMETTRVLPMMYLRKRNSGNVTALAYGLLHGGLWMIILCLLPFSIGSGWNYGEMSVPFILSWLVLQLLGTMLVWYGTCLKMRGWLLPCVIALHMVVVGVLLFFTLNYPTFVLVATLVMIAILALVVWRLHLKFRNVRVEIPADYGNWHGLEAPKK